MNAQPFTDVPEIRPLHFRMPRAHRIKLDLVRVEAAPMLAVTNPGADRRFWPAVNKSLGLAIDDEATTGLTWHERDDITPGWNGYEEMCRIPPGDTRHVLLPLPWKYRYVAKVGVWDETGNFPTFVNFVVVRGTQYGKRGVTSAGYSAWFIDEPLIWASWSISDRARLSQ